MSRQAAGTAESIGVGKGLVAALVVVGTALVLLLIVRARPGPEPFDPRSSAPNGATALVALAERTGAEVNVARNVPAVDPDTRLLVLVDQLDDEQRSATLDFIEGGGTAIVADPTSTIHGGPDLEGGSVAISNRQFVEERRDVEEEANVDRGECTIEALSLLRGVYVPDGVLFPVGPEELRCFSDGAQSFVIVRRIGDGIVVGLGDNEPFTNENLRRADNAGLATALLAPTVDTRLTILLGNGTAQSVADVGSGDDTLFDLVPNRVWMGLVLAALGFVAFAISRSVRVGAVLDEPLATPIAASQLVSATGNLMQRAKHTSKAGWLLQTQLHRDLCREFHVDAGATLAELEAAVASRRVEPGISIEHVLRRTVTDDNELLALSGQIDQIRKEVFQ